jgi:uncharacterized protein YecT (DUF1311 family)
MYKILLPFLVFFSIQAQALEEGDECLNTTKLPPNFTCFDSMVYDCNEGNQSNYGRMGYVACGGAKTENLRKELNNKYKSLLNDLKKSAKNGQDFKRARTSLIKSQNAWEHLKDAECNLDDSLLGTGNTSAGVAVDCENERLLERIERLKYIEDQLQ